MSIKRFLAVAPSFAVVLLVSCGGHGVTLGEFPAITKTEGDPPFALKAPSSASPAGFTYASGDTTVATIAGDTVTVRLAGTTTITAQQPEMGSYYATSTSTVLTVKPRVCTAPTVRENGLCVDPCIAPATRVNGECAAPAVATASFVTKDARTWMPASFAISWNDASAFCTGSKINGQTGWKLASEFDLAQLYASSLLAGKGWSLGKTWSSTSGATATSHLAVNLASGASGSEANENSAYVVCVR
jgi:hypothetical protein